MGTSNWQQIPFCIDALMKIEPRRVLDIGVGFGRWGMIVREFCDVWFSRVFRDQWQVHVEGVEAFPKSITDYHHQFYNQIHLGDAAKLIPTLPGPWSVTIYGDVLEHFTKEKAHELLSYSLEHSDYVLVNIPIGEEHPQGDAYGNEFERHLSSWDPADFVPFGLCRHALFKDYIGRDYGSFILSKNDPRNLRESLFSQAATYASQTSGADDLELSVIARRIEEQRFELEFLKKSGSYRFARRVREHPLVRRLVEWKLGDRNLLTIRPLPLDGGRSAEAWVLSVHAHASEPALPWEYVRTSGFKAVESKFSAHGTCYMHSRQDEGGAPGELRVRTTSDPAVRFMTHVGSTRVQVTFNGRSEIINLRNQEPVDLIVYPGRTPMVPRPASAKTTATTAQAKVAAPEPVGAA
ncbi:MAG TPA: hypothetical protein VD997_13785 [Phycisphaerales bacterium]|nr:hypothetical protein [Phycisphaerales bacterium]